MSKPKAVKPPPVPAPQAIPQETGQAGDEEAKKIRRAGGYQKQIMAGNLSPMSTGKKSKLG